MTDTLKHRPEIDGLRSIAVVPVLMFHAGLSFFKGGFIGVDIFFVISGYLITAILVKEMGDRRFSILRFYERRIKRIFPALFVTMAITLLASLFILVPSQIKDVGQSIVACSLFLSNYFFYNETDYFNQFTNHAPLLHTWTLSVEEQFYIFYPIVLMLSTRLGLRFTTYVTAIIFLISLMLAQYTIVYDRTLAFYSIHTRAWELMTGSLLTLLTPVLGRRLAANGTIDNRVFREVVTWAGLLVIIGSILLFSDKTPHPSYFTAFPVFATAVLLFFTAKDCSVRTLLSLRPMTYIGLISYGLYLYHNPVFAFVDVLNDTTPNKATYQKLLSIPGILLFCVLSYKFIECPVRYNRSYTTRSVIISAIIAITVFGGIGYFIHKMNGFQAYFASRFAAQGGVLLVDVDAERERIFKFREQRGQTDIPFSCGVSCTKILAVGDSFSQDADVAIYSLQRPDIEVRRIYLDDPCLSEAIEKMRLKQAMECDQRPVNLNLIEQADIVLLTEKWQESTYGPGFKFAQLLASMPSKRVYVVGSILFADLSSMSMQLARTGITPAGSAGVMWRYQRWDRFAVSEKLKSLVTTDTRLNWIEKRDFFCDRQKESCMLFDKGGNPLIWDNAHLTVRNYQNYGNFLVNHMRIDQSGVAK
ncbi:acyltransferase family protein [Novosphingobium soli]|uniref:Acyltransferase family protein n=1 Tax=Novosphingobium soli TaxID=574956 RepID=A0ABV6CWA3_9SPHN